MPGVSQSEKCGVPGCGWYTLGDVPDKIDGNNITITGYGGNFTGTGTSPQSTHTGALLSVEPDKEWLLYSADTTVSLNTECNQAAYIYKF